LLIDSVLKVATPPLAATVVVAAQRAAAWIRADRHGHVRVVERNQVAELIKHLHAHRRTDEYTGHGIARLYAEPQVVGRGRGNAERGRGGAGEAASLAVRV